MKHCPHCGAPCSAGTEPFACPACGEKFGCIVDEDDFKKINE